MDNRYDVSQLIDSPSALSQEQGDIVYEIVSKAISEKREIILDFENVESMITPFLNNAIGQLYGKYTSEEIRKYLDIANFPPTKKQTLNLVISNAKQYYENQQEYTRIAKEVLNGE